MIQRTFGPEEPVPSSRQPGRSFEDHRRPLGQDLIEAAQRAGEDATVEDRAKALLVLRKADEFMATENPAPGDRRAARRAIELAAGRVGVYLHEFDDILRRDPELEALQRRLFEEDELSYRRHHEGELIPPPESRH